MIFDGFVGIPYRAGGHDRSGASCYGLVAIVYDEMLRLELAREVDPGAWREVEKGTEQPLDVVLLRERPWHLGLVVQRGRMLHMPEGKTSVVEPYTTGRHASRVSGLYRHVSRI
ncbi:NlpC/P60 family protein [Mangrovibrevibacter kandeliae]|uniref:NlpC/P60 family protein n=1 Tax=Mangrovibrevibacter kandeliae TaxID=2968473 RepID=UPI0021183C4F|nr:C40 family peptidase [Aurantimonas sp. CSK15Z-1]